MNRKQGAGVVSSRKAARAGAGAATPTTFTLSELKEKKKKPDTTKQEATDPNAKPEGYNTIMLPISVPTPTEL